MKHSTVVALANQKGGTGKTTTAINLAGALSDLGKHVLVVDLDPQSSMTIGLGVNATQLEQSMYDVLIQGVPVHDIILAVRDTIHLAPTNINLSVAEIQLVSEIRREDRLRGALAPIKDDYDFVLIDCPPSLGLLTVNALSAADGVIIPMSTDYYSLVGVTLLLNTIRRMKSQLNPDLEVLGVLATRFDRRTLHAQEVLDEVRQKLDGQCPVYDTVIRESVRIKEAPIAGKTITEYQANHPAAQDYVSFAKEFLAHV